MYSTEYRDYDDWFFGGPSDYSYLDKDDFNEYNEYDPE